MENIIRSLKMAQAERKEKLAQFEKAIGQKFRLKTNRFNGSAFPPLVDHITGIDWKFEQVRGKKYGSFHIDLCELIPADPRRDEK